MIPFFFFGFFDSSNNEVPDVIASSAKGATATTFKAPKRRVTQPRKSSSASSFINYIPDEEINSEKPDDQELIRIVMTETDRSEEVIRKYLEDVRLRLAKNAEESRQIKAEYERYLIEQALIVKQKAEAEELLRIEAEQQEEADMLMLMFEMM